MAGLGVARLDDLDLLLEAGADLVVTTLDDVSAGVPMGTWRSAGQRAR